MCLMARRKRKKIALVEFHFMCSHIGPFTCLVRQSKLDRKDGLLFAWPSLLSLKSHVKNKVIAKTRINFCVAAHFHKARDWTKGNTKANKGTTNRTRGQGESWAVIHTMSLQWSCSEPLTGITIFLQCLWPVPARMESGLKIWISRGSTLCVTHFGRVRTEIFCWQKKGTFVSKVAKFLLCFFLSKVLRMELFSVTAHSLQIQRMRFHFNQV